MYYAVLQQDGKYLDCLYSTEYSIPIPPEAIPVETTEDFLRNHPETNCLYVENGQVKYDQELADKIAFNNQQTINRINAYRNYSDPMFFKAQRGEATMEQWQEAIQQIKATFPYQE